ncbi:Putative ribosome biogenesis GTPase RsgA [Leminorella richardii]|uniref:Small ribosomal subunit biogenesis GTPase RsgA n=1 Tax=Leminorella richardii TaxID=158841 RepID=A0A2X4V9Y1_9GAMM|nr:small ribosomal subunit biogenesis GTPase RsgA [Leminorella richardii]SQI43542.1 Putative ribosome biogenesis GTPase RsgA [Leminorella richardii]
MNKKKLSKGQQRRVAANHQRRLQAVNQKAEPDDSLFDEPQEGIVVSRFGKHADVEADDGSVHRCNIRRTVPSLVTGDRIVWRPALAEHAKGIIEAVHERTSVLTRPDFYDGVKPIAANVDRIVIVSAILPELSLNIIDRYLVACETVGIAPLIVLNKVDLLDSEGRDFVEQAMQIYRNIGYPVLLVSSISGEGMDELTEALKGHINVFAGQSGVGKSSLLNALLPPEEATIDVGDVSDVSGLGQHTTTASRLYHLPNGSDIIDSPGVREFGLWHLEPEQVTHGFIEFREFIGHCRFRDCKHVDDPGCAIREAVDAGTIAEERYDNYLKILTSMAEVRSRKNPNDVKE